MSKAVPYLIQGSNVILVIDGKSHTISKSTHIAYGKIIDALKAKDWDALRDLVEPKKAIVNFGKGFVTIENNKVLWKGQPFHNALATRMIEMYQDGFPIDPMVRFMENLFQNPSKRSVDQVYGFLEKNKLPITEDGYFLAYKKVNKNYTDIHSGKFDNSVGAYVEMDRNLVDDNPDSHCSVGLHFCSETYLTSFGKHDDPVMILKISPADVVAIPTDHNGAKGRCSKYEVVAQVNGRPADAFATVVNGQYSAPAPAAKKAPRKKVAPVADAPVWPTPVKPTAVKAAWPFPTAKGTKTQLYDVVRVNGGYVEGVDLDLAAAQARVIKNHNGKKAKLVIVKAGTDEEA